MCHKSNKYASDLVNDGLAIWLDGHKAVQCLPPDGVSEEAKDDSNLNSNGDAGTLTLSTIVHNAVGCADIRKRPLLGVEYRAMQKVQNYGRASYADCVVVV